MYTQKPARSAQGDRASATPTAISIATPIASTILGARLPTLIVLALGITIIATIGFAGSEMLHGAAHDLRHASGFPCH